MKKYAVVFAGLAAALAVPGAAHAAPDDSWNLVRNIGLGACVDAAPENTTTLTGCDGSRSQRWQLEQAGPDDEFGAAYRLRKNDWECAELAGDWAHARLALSPCALHSPSQLFHVRPAEGGLQITGHEHNQLLKAYRWGEAPFTSATLEWPGPNASWIIEPIGG